MSVPTCSSHVVLDKLLNCSLSFFVCKNEDDNICTCLTGLLCHKVLRTVSAWWIHGALCVLGAVIITVVISMVTITVFISNSIFTMVIITLLATVGIHLLF